MSILKRIFAGSETTKEIVSGTKEIVDAAFFTQQEKSEAGRKAFELWIQFMEATKGQNLARRYIAMIVMAMWAGLVVITVLAGLLAWVFGAETQPHAVVLHIVDELRVTEIVLLIMFFYFGKHAVSAYVNGGKK